MLLRHIPYDSPEHAAAVALRDRRLRAPLGLCYSADDLAAESGDWHLGAFELGSGVLVAVLILARTAEGAAKMRQVAVEEEFEGQGWGSALVRFAEGFALEQGFPEIVLHARAGVVPFYERLGYRVEGEPFMEVSIPHRRMRKSLVDH